MEKVLPKGWIISNIEQSVTILDNIRKPVSATERAKRLGNIPYYGATGLAGYIDDYLFDEELVLIGEDGAPFFDKQKNVAFIISGKSWVNNHAHVLKAKTNTLNKFILHYLNQFDYNGFVGGTTRLKLTQGDLKKIPFPLPPLPEQDRIVAKLDTLFAQHEKIKKALDRIPQLLKTFRQQVLTHAVTGKLTKQWREGKDLADWSTPMLKEVCFGFKYGSSSKSDDEGKVVVLRMGNLQNGKLDLCDLKYSNDEVEIRKYYLEPGDVLFNRTNSPDLVGKTSIYKGEIPAIYAGYLIKIENDKTVLDSDYLNFYMNTPQVRKWCNEVKSDGVSQSNINAKKLADLEILLPPLQEQKEIVLRVESLFAKADAIEVRYQTLKAKIDNLPQAILHKAFKGELVAQLPTDGDAKELLAEIMALKAEPKGKKRK